MAVRAAARARGGDGAPRASCSSSPTASSPTARATGSIRCWRWCSTCCCSTRPTRAASPTSSPASREHLAALPQSKQGASLTEERRLILSMLTSIRLADVERFAADSTRARAAGRRAQPAPPAAAAHDGHRAALFQSHRGAAAPRAHAARAASHDLRRQPSARSTATRRPWRSRSTSCTCRRAPSSGRRSRGTRCSSSRRRRSAPSARTTTATASCMFDIEQEHQRAHRARQEHHRRRRRPSRSTCRRALPWEALAAAHRRCQAAGSISRSSATPARPSTRARRVEIAAYARPSFAAGRAGSAAASGTSSRASTTTSCSTRPRPTSRRRSCRCCSSAAASARISRIWRSPACAPCTCRPATSAATS